MQGQTDFLKLFSVKLIENTFYTCSLCSNPCLGPLRRIELSFFLLSIFADDDYSKDYYISTCTVNFYILPLEWEKNQCLSNPILYPEYLYWSKSAFSVKLTAPNKHFSIAE